RRAYPGRSVEPVRVVGQVKIASAARYGASVLDGAQELRVAQGSHVVAADRRQVLAQFDEVRHQGLQAPRVDAGLGLVLLEYVDMTLELFQYVAARVASRRNRQDLEQACDRSAGTPGIGRLGVIRSLGVEKFQAQEGPHALVEWLLIDDRCRLEVRVGVGIGMRVHLRILSQPEGQGKPRILIKSRSGPLDFG